MTALAATLPRLFNATMQVKEWQGDVVFLHEVIPGAADHSYGIQVAKLAGLPGAVLARANEVLTELEKADGRPKPSDLASDLPLFSAAKGVSPAQARRQSALEATVGALRPDAMTPREALEAIYTLKGLLDRTTEP